MERSLMPLEPKLGCSGGHRCHPVDREANGSWFNSSPAKTRKGASWETCSSAALQQAQAGRLQIMGPGVIKAERASGKDCLALGVSQDQRKETEQPLNSKHAWKIPTAWTQPLPVGCLLPWYPTNTLPA